MKVVTIALQDSHSAALLGSHWQQLTVARINFVQALETARLSLASNPLTKIVAEAVARQEGRKGTASIVVCPDGQLLVEVSYKSRENGKQPRAWNSNLPSLETLRVDAVGLGIDPLPFGRSKTRLTEAIKAAQTPRPKMFRTSPALLTVVEPPDSDPTN